MPKIFGSKPIPMPDSNNPCPEGGHHSYVMSTGRCAKCGATDPRDPEPEPR